MPKKSGPPLRGFVVLAPAGVRSAARTAVRNHAARNHERSRRSAAIRPHGAAREALRAEVQADLNEVVRAVLTPDRRRSMIKLVPPMNKP
jgi:hypothetical protein